MIHEKLVPSQFLIEAKNDNLLHSTNAHHTQVWFNAQAPGYNRSHPLTQQALYHSALSQVALQQMCQSTTQRQAQLIGSAVQAACNGHHQSTTEVLDLSRRETCESSSTAPKTPLYKTNLDNGDESPARSPTNNQQSPQFGYNRVSGIYESKDKEISRQMPSYLLCNAQHPMGRFAPFYPVVYSSIDNIHKESNAATTTSQSPALTPPSSNTPLFAAQPQTSPPDNDTLAVATVTAAATTTTSTTSSVKSEDICIAPLSPISSHDGRSISPIRSTQNVAPTNPSTSGSSGILSALQTTTTRPFKAFPRDPLVIAANFAATDILLDTPRGESYTDYRNRMLKQMKTKNGGALTVTNPKMRRMNTRRRSSGSINATESINSEGDERQGTGADDSSDCDSSYAGCQAENNNGRSNDNDNNNTDAASNNCSSTGQVKDAAYYERRRKNNAAAKKSRDRRRIKEDEIAMRAAFLERQNIQLLSQITTLKQQLAVFTSKAVSA